MALSKTRDGIRKFRDRSGLNQVQLAEKLGIVQGNITAWESGRGTPSFQKAKKLLELGITVEELFGIGYNEMQGLIKQSALSEDSKFDLVMREIKDMKGKFESLRSEVDFRQAGKPASQAMETKLAGGVG